MKEWVLRLTLRSCLEYAISGQTNRVLYSKCLSCKLSRRMLTVENYRKYKC